MEEDKKPLLSVSNNEFLLESDARVCKLETSVSPLDADHSYNGIMFDIKVQGIESIIILAFVVAGQLGPVKVYTQKDTWTDEENSQWNVVFSDTLRGSLSSTTTLPLPVPVVIHSLDRQAFYIHSETHHDHGIVYQSYWHKQSVVAEDKNIVMYPGRARLGAEPFSYGIWRYNRGFSGAVVYKTIPKVWSKKNHKEFPLTFKRVVLLLLLAQSNQDCIFHLLPVELIFKILQNMEWDSFEGTADEDILYEIERKCCCILQ